MRDDQRKIKRHYVYHGARIAGLNGSLLADCRMLDVSGTGARLEVKTPDVIPDELVLLLSHDGRLHRRCRVIWRSEVSIGVKFADDSGADPP